MKKHKCILVKALLTFFIISTFLIKAECQESDTSGSIIKGGTYEKTFTTSRIGLAQSVMNVPKGEFHFVIQHRFGELKGGAYELFGLDGALPRIGFEYGISGWLSASIGRSLLEKSYDLGLKTIFLKQSESGIPVSLSYYISVLCNTLKDYFPAGHNSFGSRLSYINQIFLARNQGIFSFQVSPMWVHSSFDVREGKVLDIWALDLGGKIKFSEKLGMFAEYIPILKSENSTRINPLTIGLDINTGGHQFQLFFSNSQGTNEKAITSSTVGSWSKGRIFFGFNLTRVFHPRMD